MHIYKHTSHHIYIYMNKSINLLHSTLTPKKTHPCCHDSAHSPPPSPFFHTFPPLENRTSVGDCSNAKASSNLTASHNAQVPARATTKEAHKEPPRKAKLTKIWWKKTWIDSRVGGDVQGNQTTKTWSHFGIDGGHTTPRN